MSMVRITSLIGFLLETLTFSAVQKIFVYQM
jgi:hypothetical protein